MSSDQPRQPAGAPTGGQFTSLGRTEPGVALTPPTITDHKLAVGDTVHLSAWEAETDILNDVEIIHGDDGYRAQGAMPLNFIDGALEILEVDITRGATDTDVERAEAWLDTYGPVIDAFITDRYGCELDDSPEWEHVRAVFTTHVDPGTDTVPDVVNRLETSTSVVQLYNEYDAGTFGVPYLWHEVRDHVNDWEERARTAEEQFAADVVDDTGMPYPQALDQAHGTVRAFMTRHHRLVEAARAAHREAHGTDYGTLGRDLSLALHNEAGSPHGRLAFRALPAEHAQAMRDALARIAPTFAA